MKEKLVTLITALLSFTSAAQADSHSTCPKIGEIHRTPGEYSWNTTVSGWEGFFAAPVNGKGHSNKVNNFLAARWIQFTNLPNSPGYVQCDYAGDLGDELIRFVQQGNKATARPESIQWSVLNNLTFPSVQRECGGSSEACFFEQL